MLPNVSVDWTIISTFSQAASVCSATLYVAEGKGVPVGVGWGMSRGWLIYKLLQAAGKLFIVTILCTETSKKAAIPMQVSSDFTRYVMGVGLGSGVLVKVGRGVFVAVWVLVAVAVTVAVAVGGIIASGFC